jgi:hypothetical protein
MPRCLLINFVHQLLQMPPKRKKVPFTSGVAKKKAPFTYELTEEGKIELNNFTARVQKLQVQKREQKEEGEWPTCEELYVLVNKYGMSNVCKAFVYIDKKNTVGTVKLQQLRDHESLIIRALKEVFTMHTHTLSHTHSQHTHTHKCAGSCH